MGRFLVVSISLIALVQPAALAQQDSVFVAISGDTVKVWNTDVQANCASRFAFSVVSNDTNTFTITERDTVGPIAKCICNFDLFVVLPGITHAGSYYVRVYRQYLKKFFYTMDTTVFIGTAGFTIVSQSSSQISERFYQSKCGGIVNVEVTAPQVPSRIWLYQSYPNPFNPSATIKFELPSASHVNLSVFDILGREVSVLVDDRKDAGIYEVKFDGSNLASGVYFYRLQAGSFVQTKKLMILR